MPIPYQLPQRSIVQQGPVSYLVRNRVEYKFPRCDPLPVSSLTPAIVITQERNDESIDFIHRAFSRFEAEDDVFSTHFTNNGFLIIQHSRGRSPSLGWLSSGLSWGLQSVIILDPIFPLPEGPYFIFGQCLYQAWRLYPDSLSAFASAVLPADEEEPENGNSSATRFQHFHTASFTDSMSCVAVPSRLYYKRTEAKPLAGVRVTVKDNMHLAGVTTGLGNRAYATFYGKCEVTSEYVQSLIDKGAIIIGKTKLSAFAGSEIPPNQCTDYFPPWNPRGDGYQGPSGSSSGAAASVAGYPWVDVALCTDTSGSMRHPASSHGTWGHRITRGALPMKNIVPAVPLYDNIGLLTRTATQLQELLSATNIQKSTSKLNKLIYPTDWYPVANEGQQKMNMLFLQALESYLGIERTELSLKEQWSQTAPGALRNTPLDEYLGQSAIIVNAYFVFHTFDDFRREYRKRFRKEPYVSPAHKARWDRGEKVSEKELDESLEKIQVFKEWVDRYIWNVDDPSTFTIMILPQGRPGANYRDVVGTPAGGSDPGSYTPIFTTSMIGCPQLVVPIGQNPYKSRVSGETEYAPIMTSIIGPSNTDASLIEVAEGALKKVGWPSTILTGRLMFTTDNNERNAKAAPRDKTLEHSKQNWRKQHGIEIGIWTTYKSQWIEKESSLVLAINR